MEPLEIGSNTGFIPVDPKSSDWKSGGETGILDVARLPSSDWRPYLSDGKWQKLMGVAYNGGNGFETDACVSFSGIDAVQAYMNWALLNGQYSADNVKFLHDNGYIGADGKVNLSPRFTAKMSGTTINGNTLPNVCNSLRHDGCVPDARWPMPAAQIQADVPNAWNIYYEMIPPDVVNLGVEFAARFSIQYEWIVYPGVQMDAQSFLNALKVSALQIATAVCAPWNTAAPIQGCGSGTAHATLLDFVDSVGEYDIRDHYEPFDKIFAANYTIPYGMRIVVGEQAIVPTTTPAFTHHFTTAMALGDRNSEVVALQNALKADGCLSLNITSTGYYGSITQASVLAFQIKHQVDTPAALNQLNGTRVGPKTLAALNVLFNK